MKMNMLSRRVIKYLKSKDLNSFGFIKYSYFKRLISHITNTNNNYELRKIFLHLVDTKYIIKKKKRFC